MNTRWMIIGDSFGHEPKALVHTLQSFFFYQKPSIDAEMFFHFEPWMDFESLFSQIPRTVLDKAPTHLVMCPEVMQNTKWMEECIDVFRAKTHAQLAIVTAPEPFMPISFLPSQLDIASKGGVKLLRFDQSCSAFIDVHLKRDGDQMGLWTLNPKRLSTLGTLLLARDLFNFFSSQN